MRRVRGGRRVSAGPGLEEVIVIALASARIARAISVDDISEPARDALRRWAAEAGDEPSSRLRQFACDLVGCPVCVGWWTSLGMSLTWPGRMRLRRGIAVAGVQVIVALVERLVSEQGRLAIREADGA